MKNYEKGNIPYVIFGSKTAGRLGQELKQAEIRKCLMVSGKHVIRHPITEQIQKDLEALGIGCDIYDKVTPEPSDTLCLEIASEIRKNGYDCVIGIGGGSPMDAAKAAALIAGIPEEIDDLHEYGKSGAKMKERWRRPCFLALVPTTAGTGAETTASSVITSTVHGLKFSFGNRHISADLCVIDPDFTLGMPAMPTVYGGVDALAHSVEILVGTGSNEYTDLILLSCVEKIWKWLPVAVKEPENQEAREQLSWAAHNALANGGIPNGHAVAHALGSLYHVTHGHACALVLPTVIRHFAATSQDAIRQIAKRMNIAVSQNAEADAKEVAEAIRHFCRSLGLKSLQETLRAQNNLEDEQTFTEKMIPAIMDDFKSRCWMPPIHTGDYQKKTGDICRSIYEEN